MQAHRRSPFDEALRGAPGGPGWQSRPRGRNRRQGANPNTASRMAAREARWMLRRVDVGDRPGHHAPGDGPVEDEVVEPGPRVGREELGVAQPGDGPAGIEDDGGGGHRAGQAAPADLVHPGHPGDPARRRAFSRRRAGRCGTAGAARRRHQAWGVTLRSLPSCGPPCRAGRAGSTASRGGPWRCARPRSCRSSASAAGRCARRPGRTTPCAP